MAFLHHTNTPSGVGNAGSVSRHGGQNGKGHGHRPIPCRDDAQPGAVADPLRGVAGYRDPGRHHHDGRRIPRACSVEQRARIGKHCPAADPSLRPAVRGFRYDRRRRDLPTCDFEHRFVGGIQRTDVEPEGTRDLELQSRRGVLSRRYLHFRFEWRHDHLVETVAGSGH
jgi:hypothetical protein